MSKVSAWVGLGGPEFRKPRMKMPHGSKDPAVWAAWRESEANNFKGVWIDIPWKDMMKYAVCEEVTLEGATGFVVQIDRGLDRGLCRLLVCPEIPLQDGT
jgi:hypothetical protein